MPITQRYKPTAAFDPATAVTAWEAEDEVQDATLSGHFGSNVEAEISTNLVHMVVESEDETDSTAVVAAATEYATSRARLRQGPSPRNSAVESMRCFPSRVASSPPAKASHIVRWRT